MKLNRVAMELDPKTPQKEFARALDVDPRTVRNWKKRNSPEDFPKLGRPAHDERAHRLAFWRTGREYLRQGRCGWRGISLGLRGGVPDRLIQIHLKRFKACEKWHKRRRIQSNQVRMEVLAKNALWVQDSAQVGRDLGGLKIESQIIKDRGPLVTVGLSTGKPTRAEDVPGVMDKLKVERGLPLVIGTDNGPPFRADLTQEYFEREKIIHLRSLPRTPQHNGSAEVGIGELCEALVKCVLGSWDCAHAIGSRRKAIKQKSNPNE